MKIHIDTDEWYPVYSPVFINENSWMHKHYELHDVSDDLLSRWNKIKTDFVAFQAELKALRDGPGPGPGPGPEPLIPLDIDDIRATDEFKSKYGETIYAPLFWGRKKVKTAWDWCTYEELATNYLRRQHGSNEWKPCTKETK